MTDDDDPLVSATPDRVRGRRVSTPGSPSARRAAARRVAADGSPAEGPEAPPQGAALVTHALLARDGAADADLPRTLIITCGALVAELFAVARANGWSHLEVTAIPASHHNRPERITAAVRAKIRAARGRFARILVLYGDCGTGGELDRMLGEEQIERIEGPHCYAFFTGLAAFERLAEEEVATFYLTDFLARHFERLVLGGLGLERQPDLLPLYFRNYRRVVHLVQIPDPETTAAARAAAARLGLPLVTVETGLGEIARFLAPGA